MSVVNPARIKGFAQGELARNKTDRADAMLLARFCAAMRPGFRTPPAVASRELRGGVDRLQALTEMHQQESNRMEAHPASGQTVKSRTMMSRTGHNELRRALYMPSLVARHHNPVLKTFGDRLSATGLALKAIVGAVMRKLAHLIYGVIKSGQPFDASFNHSALAIQDST